MLKIIKKKCNRQYAQPGDLKALIFLRYLSTHDDN